MPKTRPPSEQGGARRPLHPPQPHLGDADRIDEDDEGAEQHRQDDRAAALAAADLGLVGGRHEAIHRSATRAPKMAKR